MPVLNMVTIEITDDQIDTLCEENESARWPEMSTALTQAIQAAVFGEPRSEDLPHIPASPAGGPSADEQDAWRRACWEGSTTAGLIEWVTARRAQLAGTPR